MPSKKRRKPTTRSPSLRVRVQLLLVVIGLLVAIWQVGRWIHPPVPIHLDFRQMRVLARPMKPLLDLIGSVEGDYHSVNRGRAGDSPGDWAHTHLGRSITDMTLDELRSHQGGSNRACWHRGVAGDAGLFAVGRYQLVPCTLAGAVRRVEGLELDLTYDKDTQDALAVYLLLMKRRRLGAWLLGQTDDYTRAAQELAKEFASMPIQTAHRHCSPGQSYYCGDHAGNAALVPLEAVEVAMRESRAALGRDPWAREVIGAAEGPRGHLRRHTRMWWRGVKARWAE